MLPDLLFDEAELARLGAAVACDAASRARRACAARCAAGHSAAMARAAEALTRAVQARRRDEAQLLGQVVRLTEAIGRALLADEASQRDLVTRVRSLLRSATDAPAVHLHSSATDEAAMRAVLAELAAGAEADQTIELVVEAGLPAGAIRLTWPDGWLEHAPDSIRARIDAILRSGPQLVATALPSTSDGDDDA